MSFSRVALRYAALEALCPSTAIAAGGPFPTAAGGRVFDSRIDQIAGADLSYIENKPLAIVYTEEDRLAPYNVEEGNKYPAKEQFIELFIEIMVAVSGTLELDTPDGGTETVGTLVAPITDSQHELVLDILEGQIRYILDKEEASPTGALFRQVAMEVRSIHSVPQRSPDRDVREAARTLRLHCKVKKEVWTPGNALPVPLSYIAAGVPPTSEIGKLCASAQASLPAVPGAPSTVLEYGIFAGLGRVPSDTDFDARGSVNMPANP